METRMKLSELTYEFLIALGLPCVSMHTDSSDTLRSINSEWSFRLAKQELADKYGNVELVINPEEVWFKQIQIDDAKWKADYAQFCKAKGVWCAKHGSN